MPVSSRQTTPHQTPHKPIYLSGARLGDLVLWFAFAISGIVLIEPAPFDLVILIIAVLSFMLGLNISRQLVLFIILVSLLALFGILGTTQSTHIYISSKHIAVSIYLYFFAIFIASLLHNDPGKFKVIMSGYTVAALIAVVAGTIGYFSLVDGLYEIFTENDRMRGTLKDPNVFGVFIIVPAIYALVQILTRPIKTALPWLAVLLVTTFGVLLSFSRGAWVNLALAAICAVYLLFVFSPNNRIRLRVIGLSLLSLGLTVLILIIFSNFESISEMITTRGKLVQSYDIGHGGRFYKQGVALDYIVSNPLGSGSGDFPAVFGQPPHNVYLYQFISSGWVGGLTYLILTGITLLFAIQLVLSGAHRNSAIVLLSCFLALVLEGMIVDTDHWRHFYLLMGAIWGLKTNIG